MNAYVWRGANPRERGRDPYHDRHFRVLWMQALLRGELRFGWSINDQLDLSRGESAWKRAYRRQPEWGDADQHIQYHRTFLNVPPGSLIVCPDMPEPNGITTCVTRSSTLNAKHPCYRYLKPLGDLDDFRSALTIAPSSIAAFPPPLLRGFAKLASIARLHRFRFQQSSKHEASILKISRGQAASDAESRVKRTPHREMREFAAKDDSDVERDVAGRVISVELRHETLVNRAAQLFRAAGAAVGHLAYVDLVVSIPTPVLFEAKIVRSASYQSVREAVGQLLWYRYDNRSVPGFKSPALCVLLDKKPPLSVVEFAEEAAGVSICWIAGKLKDGTLGCGPKSHHLLAKLGIG